MLRFRCIVNISVHSKLVISMFNQYLYAQISILVHSEQCFRTHRVMCTLKSYDISLFVKMMDYRAIKMWRKVRGPVPPQPPPPQNDAYACHEVCHYLKADVDLVLCLASYQLLCPHCVHKPNHFSESEINTEPETFTEFISSLNTCSDNYNIWKYCMLKVLPGSGRWYIKYSHEI